MLYQSFTPYFIRRLFLAMVFVAMRVKYQFGSLKSVRAVVYGLFIFDPSGGDTMKICRANALRLWEECFGNSQFAEDFHGNLMCRDGYGDDDFYVYRFGKRIYCGWNIHHILPLSCGGTNEKHNLICTNIYTNDEAEDKITYWIDDCLYQVQRVYGTSEHQIIKLN